MFSFNDQLDFGVYVYLGHQEGSFTPQGQTSPQQYKHMFVLHAAENSQFRTISGFVSEKLKVASPSVWAGLSPGDKIYLFFNQYGLISAVRKAE